MLYDDSLFLDTLLPQVVLHQLESAQPQAVSELRSIMSEAQRVTVTWEERWQALLLELQADVGRRCVSLQVWGRMVYLSLISQSPV